MYGPAGAGVWSAPTIDAKRKLVYVATGDSYTDVELNTSDAILAFRIDNGSLVWVSQVTAHDKFIVACPNRSPNCPEVLGPDYDFGSSPILRTIAGGKQIIVAAQKSGVVWVWIRTKKERSSGIRKSAPAVYKAGWNGDTVPMARTLTPLSPT